MKLEALEKVVATARKQAQILVNRTRESGQAAQGAKEKARQAKRKSREARAEARQAKKTSRGAKAIFEKAVSASSKAIAELARLEEKLRKALKKARPSTKKKKASRRAAAPKPAAVKRSSAHGVRHAKVIRKPPITRAAPKRPAVPHRAQRTSKPPVAKKTPSRATVAPPVKSMRVLKSEPIAPAISRSESEIQVPREFDSTPAQPPQEIPAPGDSSKTSGENSGV